MTNIVLTNDLKEIVLKQYHPIIDIDLWSLQQSQYDNEHNTTNIILNDTVNLKILTQDIEQLLSEQDKIEYQKYVSKPTTIHIDEFEYTVNTGTFNNIIFTPQDNTDIIIPYEYYKGVFYLTLPRFYRVISLHILTSYFDASDNVVLFTTEDAINYINDGHNPSTKWQTYNGAMTRDIDKINIIGNNGIGRYLIELPETLKGLNTIEIDVFYKYLYPPSKTNQIGIIDTTTRGYANIQSDYEDQKTLINQNNNTAKSIITAMRQTHDIIEDNAFQYSSPIQSFSYPAHIDNALYESTIKYFNDDIYIEEYNQRTSDIVNRIEELKTNDNYNYQIVEWTEEN